MTEHLVPIQSTHRRAVVPSKRRRRSRGGEVVARSAGRPNAVADDEYRNQEVFLHSTRQASMSMLAGWLWLITGGVVTAAAAIAFIIPPTLPVIVIAVALAAQVAALNAITASRPVVTVHVNNTSHNNYALSMATDVRRDLGVGSRRTKAVPSTRGDWIDVGLPGQIVDQLGPLLPPPPQLPPAKKPRR